jgi:pyrroloquinoline-quinone synthase
VSRPGLHAALAVAAEGRRLLSHPFYVRWEAGELREGELAAYASQYRHFERALPGFLRRLLSRLQNEAAADFVRRNLADEESNPRPHAELFEDFALAVGAADAVATTPAMSQLLATYDALIERGAADGLAAVVAYEMQAPDIAASKAEGLRARYGIDALGTRFWDVHAVMDADHADWSVSALAALGADTQEMATASRMALDAWWALLDEREAASC